jgi:hypothetical protein
MVTPRVGATAPVSPWSVSQLLCHVREARVDLQASRNSTGSDRLQAQESLVAALVLYTAALTSRGLPVPYLLRDELRLHSDVVVARSR